MGVPPPPGDMLSLNVIVAVPLVCLSFAGVFFSNALNRDFSAAKSVFFPRSVSVDYLGPIFVVN